VIFPSTLTHAENLQHAGCGFKSDGLAFLLDGKCRQKNGDNPVLAEGHAIVGMAGDLEDERTILVLIDELPSGQRPDRQAAKNEWGTEAQILLALFSFEAHQLNTVQTMERL
jgi:hypothetical protein